MTEPTDTELAALNWGDAQVYGYYWDPSVDTSNLSIVVKPANSDRVDLVARWVKQFKIDVDYSGEFYPLLTWETRFRPGDILKWHVLFDFASDGSIEFECEELYLRAPAPVSAA